MGGNQLTDIPAELGYLYKLTYLVLCDNRLQSLPPTLSNLRKLRSLSLHNNLLQTLPQELVSLNLVELSLRNNPLVVRFVQELSFNPPSLMELAGRVIKIERVKYGKTDLPSHLVKYLSSAQRCVNPKCKGKFFSIFSSTGRRPASCCHGVVSVVWSSVRPSVRSSVRHP